MLSRDRQPFICAVCTSMVWTSFITDFQHQISTWSCQGTKYLAHRFLELPWIKLSWNYKVFFLYCYSSSPIFPDAPQCDGQHHRMQSPKAFFLENISLSAMKYIQEAIHVERAPSSHLFHSLTQFFFENIDTCRRDLCLYPLSCIIHCLPTCVLGKLGTWYWG